MGIRSTTAALRSAKPQPAPTPLVGREYKSSNVHGTIYDFQAFLRQEVGVPASEKTLKLIHHTTQQWAPSGKFEPICDHAGGYSLFREGFYTSTEPLPFYGPLEFELGLPIAKLAGKEIIEVPYLSLPSDFKMPNGVNVLVTRPPGKVFIIFKPGSGDWVNKIATRSEFDKPGDPCGWNADTFSR